MKRRQHDFFLDAGALRHSTGPELQHSILKLQDCSAVVNEIGYLNDVYGMVKHGYWAWEGRLSNMLPLDYENRNH